MEAEKIILTKNQMGKFLKFMSKLETDKNIVKYWSNNQIKQCAELVHENKLNYSYIVFLLKKENIYPSNKQKELFMKYFSGKE